MLELLEQNRFIPQCSEAGVTMTLQLQPIEFKAAPGQLITHVQIATYGKTDKVVCFHVPTDPFQKEKYKIIAKVQDFKARSFITCTLWEPYFQNVACASECDGIAFHTHPTLDGEIEELARLWSDRSDSLAQWLDRVCAMGGLLSEEKQRLRSVLSDFI